MYLAAARVSDPAAVIDHKLYWATASTIGEAQYLTAILNSDVLTQLVRPLQARGEHNPRDFDKYIFQLPIPCTTRAIPSIGNWPNWQNVPKRPPPSNCHLAFPSRPSGAG